MTIVKARVQSGRVEQAVPNDWPNGLEVEIRPVAMPSTRGDELITAEEIASTLAAMRAYQPMEESDVVHRKTEEMIKERKEQEKRDFQQRLERLKKEWE